jgi:hypothetical protein
MGSLNTPSRTIDADEVVETCSTGLSFEPALAKVPLVKSKDNNHGHRGLVGRCMLTDLDECTRTARHR